MTPLMWRRGESSVLPRRQHARREHRSLDLNLGGRQSTACLPHLPEYGTLMADGLRAGPGLFCTPSLQNVSHLLERVSPINHDFAKYTFGRRPSYSSAYSCRLRCCLTACCNTVVVLLPCSLTTCRKP